ncbi:hypothetical protein ACEUAP_04330 [Aeromonas veronii]
MAVYPVKWFSSDMQGAPSLGDTTEGALTALLKTVLVTGFGTLTIVTPCRLMPPKGGRWQHLVAAINTYRIQWFRSMGYPLPPTTASIG